MNARADELELEAMQLAALLLEKEKLQRAIEPDTCFYIQHQALVKLLRPLNCLSKKIQVLWGVPPALNLQFKGATAYKQSCRE